MSRPAFVFVPGAWHGPETWGKVLAKLESKGYEGTAVRLPSTTGDPALGFDEDVLATQDAVRDYTEAGRNVVVVVHSYGGQVGPVAVKGFTRKSHGSVSTSGRAHVIGIAMIATGLAAKALPPPLSASSGSDTGSTPPTPTPASMGIEATPDGLAKFTLDARQVFYHDLPENEGNEWVSKMTPQSLKVFGQSRAAGGYEGWRDVPVWFLMTKEDRALKTEVQRGFVEGMREGGADVSVREVASGHSPMLSRVEETVGFLVDASADCVSKDMGER